MSNTFKIDARAFGRGVDEVLLLKPVRRVVGAIVYGKEKTTVRKTGSSTANNRRGVVVKYRNKHDEPAA